MRRIACLLIAVLAAGCSSYGGLDRAADKLDRSANNFYRELNYSSRTNHTEADAAALAEAARQFNNDVDSNRSRDYLRPSFDRVAERYHHLRRQLDDRTYRERYVNAGFDRVTDAYLDVDRAMNYPDSSRFHN